MDFKDRRIIVGLLVGLVLLVILVSYILYSNMEGFDPSYTTDKETYIKSSEVISSEPTILSNGTVQKYKDENDSYIYQGYFNLPTIGSEFQVTDLDKPFNAPLKQDNYRVMIGTDKNDMKYITDLSRESNGYYMFSYTSKENYKKVCVYIGTSIVGCVEL